MTYIIPDHIREAINKALNEQFIVTPDAAQWRNNLYNQVLEYFNEHGSLPDFTLEKTE